MGARVWAIALEGLLIAGCAGGPFGGGPCGAPYLVGAYADPGPWTDDGWYYPGDDGSDPGSASPGDPTSTGDGSGDDSGDDCGGDDSTDAVHRTHLKSARGPRRDALRLASAPPQVVAVDGNGCYSCTLTCLTASAPGGGPNAGTAMGASDVSPDDACSSAQAELSSWASDQGTTLQACRLGDATPGSAGQAAATSISGGGQRTSGPPPQPWHAGVPFR
jgi:hypothetical protein